MDYLFTATTRYLKEKKLERNMLKYSDIESRRFDFNVYRGVCEDIKEKNILEFILENNVDIAIIRVPSGNQKNIFRLNKLGMPYIIADALVFYCVNLNKHSPHDLKNKDLVFVRCSQDEYKVLGELVENIFMEYDNHYFSNPLLGKSLIMEGYKEWAQSYVTNERDGCVSWIIKKSDSTIGFATCKFNEENSQCEGVLYGVVPNEEGRGIYSDIIRFTQNYFKNKGFATMLVSTQLHNHTVQKVWNREGFVIDKSFITIHVNSMMNFSVIPKKNIEVSISTEDILNYGCLSGGMKPIQYEAESERHGGLMRERSHVLVIDSLISKYYGMEFPGSGTLLISNNTKYLKPIYTDTNYQLVISFPYIHGEIYHSLAKIVDDENRICFLSYNHLCKSNER